MLLLRSSLSAAALVLSPAGAAAQVAAEYEEGIVEIVAERLPALATVVLVDSAGSMLLPLEQVAYYVGLTTSWSGSAFTASALGGGTVAVDTLTGSMTTPAGVVDLTPAELVVRGGSVYLRAERLAAWLGADIRVDFATLTVTIERTTPFPAQQRVLAEQRRAVLIARQLQQEASAELVAAPYHAWSGAGIVDWEIATNGLDPARLTVIRTDAGAALLGGDLNGGAAFELGRDASDRVRDGTLRYHRVFPHGRYLTQVRAGDVVSNGLFARYMRGIEISNRPFARRGDLSSILVQPDLPTGWEYEVFQGNQLLGYSDVGSPDPVTVRLRAGATPVQVRMYGPAGEEVVRTLVYQAPVSLLDRDAVEYSVGAGRCPSACDEFVHADVRYGATALFTAGGGFELITDSTGARVRPYLVSSFATGTRATAELTYMPFALYASNISLYPRDGSSAHVRVSVARPGFGPISLVGGARMRWDGELMWDERIERRQSALSQIRIGAAAAGMLGGMERWRVSSTGSFSRGFVEARYDHDRISVNHHLVSARAAVFVPFTIGARTLRPLVSSAVGAGGAGIRLAELGVSIQPRPSAIVSAAAQWSRGSHQPTLSLGYSAHIGSVQSALRAVSSASGVASSSVMLSGSTAMAADGSITVQPWSRTGYAGVRGTVYIDQDGDGELSAGDAAVPGMHLLVGGHRAVADGQGRFRVWGMLPWEPATIAIDSAHAADPGWMTRDALTVVRPAPNMAMRADLQIVRTRELIGTITAAADVATVAGLSLDVTNLDTGEIITTATFSDGLFYISRLRPGRYRVAVSPASLAALAAVAVPALVEFIIPAAGDDPVVELSPVHLQRRR